MRMRTTWRKLAEFLLFAWLGMGLVAQVAQAQTAARPSSSRTMCSRSPSTAIPDLATTTRVMQNGTITFPLIGVCVKTAVF